MRRRALTQISFYHRSCADLFFIGLELKNANLQQGKVRKKMFQQRKSTKKMLQERKSTKKMLQILF